MKHIIDIENWERRDNYEFFRGFANSWYSVTTEIDCTEASAAARAVGCSFFLYYLYAVVRSANEVDELRYRMDKNGQIIFHDQVDIISPIAVPGKTFYTVRIPYHEDFRHFYAEAHALITNIPVDGDPYGAEKELIAQGDYDVVHLSAVPKMYFTATTYTLAEVGNACSWPLMTSGKVVNREGRLVFPLSIYVNHAFVDGSHLASFFSEDRRTFKGNCTKVKSEITICMQQKFLEMSMYLFLKEQILPHAADYSNDTRKKYWRTI